VLLFLCCRAPGAGHSLYKSQERIVLLMRAAIVFFVCFFVCFGILASVLFSPATPERFPLLPLVIVKEIPLFEMQRNVPPMQHQPGQVVSPAQIDSAGTVWLKCLFDSPHFVSGTSEQVFSDCEGLRPGGES